MQHDKEYLQALNEMLVNESKRRNEMIALKNELLDKLDKRTNELKAVKQKLSKIKDHETVEFDNLIADEEELEKTVKGLKTKIQELTADIDEDAFDNSSANK